MKIKIVQNKEIRVWKCPQRHQYASLLAFIARTFGLHDASRFSLQYQDDEGDTIIIKSDNDIEDAIAFAVEDGRKSLKIYVISVASMDDFLNDALGDLFAPMPAAQPHPQPVHAKSQSLLRPQQTGMRALFLPSKQPPLVHRHASVPSPLQQLLRETKSNANAQQRKAMDPEDILASMVMMDDEEDIAVHGKTKPWQPAATPSKAVRAKRMQSADDILNSMMADMQQMGHKNNEIDLLQSRIRSMPKLPLGLHRQAPHPQSQQSTHQSMMKMPLALKQPPQNGHRAADNKQPPSSVTSSDDFLRQLLGDEHVHHHREQLMDPQDVINSIVNRAPEVPAVVAAAVAVEEEASVSHRDEEVQELSMSDLKLDVSSDRKPPALSPLPASPPMNVNHYSHHYYQGAHAQQNQAEVVPLAAEPAEDASYLPHAHAHPPPLAVIAANGDHAPPSLPSQYEPTIVTNVPPVPFMQPHNSRTPSARKHPGQFEPGAGDASHTSHPAHNGLSTDDVRHAYAMDDSHEPSAPLSPPSSPPPSQTQHGDENGHNDEPSGQADALALLGQFDALPDVPKHIVNLHENKDDGQDTKIDDEEEPDAETMEEIRKCLNHPTSVHDLNLAQIHADAQRDQLPEVAPHADDEADGDAAGARKADDDDVYNAETPDDQEDEDEDEQKEPKQDQNKVLDKLYAELDDIDIDFELHQLNNAEQPPHSQPRPESPVPPQPQPVLDSEQPGALAANDAPQVCGEPPAVDMSQEIHICIDPANFELTPVPPEQQQQEDDEEADDDDEEMDLTQTTPDPIIPQPQPQVPVQPPPPVPAPAPAPAPAQPPAESEPSNVVCNAPESEKPSFEAAGDADDVDVVPDDDAGAYVDMEIEPDLNESNTIEQDGKENDADTKECNNAGKSAPVPQPTTPALQSPKSSQSPSGSSGTSDVNATSPRDQRREANRLLREEQRLQDKERKLQERHERTQQKQALQESRRQQKEDERVKRLQSKETHKQTQKYDKLRRARSKELTQFQQLSPSEIFDANKHWFPIKFVLDTATLHDSIEFETRDDIAQIVELHASKQYRSQPSLVECLFNDTNVFGDDDHNRMLLPSDAHCVVYLYYNWSTVSNIKFQCIDLELCSDRAQKLNVFRMPPWLNIKPTAQQQPQQNTAASSPSSPSSDTREDTTDERNAVAVAEVNPNDVYEKLLQDAIEKEKNKHVSRLKSMASSPLSLFKRNKSESPQPKQNMNSKSKSSTAQLLPENTEQTPNFRWKFDLTQDYHLFDPLLNDDTLRRCMHDYEIYFSQIRSQAVVHDLPRLYDIYVVYLTCIADDDDADQLICNLDSKPSKNAKKSVCLFLSTLLDNDSQLAREIMSYLRNDRCYGFVTVAKNTLPDSSAPITEQVSFHFGGIGDWFKCAIAGEHDFEQDLKALQRCGKWNNKQHLSLQTFLQNIVTTYSM